MYLKNYITGCALTCPSLFTENTDEWLSCNSVLDITFKEGLPYVQQYQLKNEILRAETGHPSTAYQLTPVLWKKWSSIGRVKISIMGTLPKHFLIRVLELGQLQSVTGTSYSLFVPVFFLLVSETTIWPISSFCGRVRTLMQFLRFYL